MSAGYYMLELSDIDCSYTKLIPLKKQEEANYENEYILMNKINLQDLKNFSKKWLKLFDEVYHELVDEQFSLILKNSYEAQNYTDTINLTLLENTEFQITIEINLYENRIARLMSFEQLINVKNVLNQNLSNFPINAPLDKTNEYCSVIMHLIPSDEDLEVLSIMSPSLVYEEIKNLMLHRDLTTKYIKKLEDKVSKLVGHINILDSKGQILFDKAGNLTNQIVVHKKENLLLKQENEKLQEEKSKYSNFNTDNVLSFRGNLLN